MDKSKLEKGKKAEVKKPEPKKAEARKGEKKIVFPFDKQNYIFLLAGLGFLGLGFILLIGGGSDDPKVFNPAIFNFQRMTIAPILIMIGYLIEVYAIMKRPTTSNEQ